MTTEKTAREQLLLGRFLFSVDMEWLMPFPKGAR